MAYLTTDETKLHEEIKKTGSKITTRLLTFNF
jgi:hypothetical protein